MANDKDETWDKLTKIYLTTDQKIEIIKKHNSDILAKQWEEVIEDLKDFINKNKDEE